MNTILEAKDHRWLDVYLNGKKIDSIYWAGNSDSMADVKKSLVNHDGYDPDIVVKISKTRVAGGKNRHGEKPFQDLSDSAARKIVDQIIHEDKPRKIKVSQKVKVVKIEDPRTADELCVDDSFVGKTGTVIAFYGGFYTVKLSDGETTGFWPEELVIVGEESLSESTDYRLAGPKKNVAKGVKEISSRLTQAGYKMRKTAEVTDTQLCIETPDGNGYLWLYLDDKGKPTALSRYGNNYNAEQYTDDIAVTLGFEDAISEHDEGYWEDEDDEGVDESLSESPLYASDMARYGRSRIPSGSPVLPVGLVNLTTGANRMFGTIWNCWEEGSCACILLKKTEWRPEGGTDRMRVVVTSISGREGVESTKRQYPDNSPLELYHDQSFARMGTYTVVGVFPYTKEGLLSLKQASGKSSLSFATFK